MSFFKLLTLVCLLIKQKFLNFVRQQLNKFNLASVITVILSLPIPNGIT